LTPGKRGDANKRCNCGDGYSKHKINKKKPVAGNRNLGYICRNRKRR